MGKDRCHYTSPRSDDYLSRPVIQARPEPSTPCTLLTAACLLPLLLPTLAAQSASGLDRALMPLSGVLVCRAEVRETPQGVLHSVEVVEVDSTTGEELRQVELTADSSHKPLFLLVVVFLPDSGEGLSVIVQFTPDLEGSMIHVRENSSQSGGFQVISRTELKERELTTARTFAESIVEGACFRKSLPELAAGEDGRG